MAFLTEDEFNNLPNEGTIDPRRIRFAQRTVSCLFKNGKCIICASIELKRQGESNFPRIKIVLYEGGVYTLNNRRLWVHQKAGVGIPYKKLIHPLNDDNIRKFTTHNKGVRVFDINFTILTDRL